MVLSRSFDAEIEERDEYGESFPHFHSGIGQEALEIAPVHALDEDDELLYTHRGYGHLLARGIPMRDVLADMKFKRTGTNDGFGGVMHVNDGEKGVPGRNGVFGTRFTIATGLGYAKQYRGTDEAVLCFYGEAAGARGPLFEAMNMLSLWDLPVVLVAENNGFSISSRTEDLYAPGDMSTFAEGFDIPREVIDGNDAETVYDTVDDALRRARNGGGPTVIEGKTYRISGHKLYDEEQYREDSEIEEWRKKDPIDRFERRLIEDEVLSESEIAAIRDRVRSRIEAVFESVPDDPEPDPEQAFDYVYHERGVEQ